MCSCNQPAATHPFGDEAFCRAARMLRRAAPLLAAADTPATAGWLADYHDLLS